MNKIEIIEIISTIDIAIGTLYNKLVHMRTNLLYSVPITTLMVLLYWHCVIKSTCNINVNDERKLTVYK